MAPSPWWRGRRLVWVLLALGIALPLLDVWHWWTSRHPVDHGTYAERADWSVPAREGVHLSAYAYRDRKTNKRNMRSLWITRINAEARVHGLSYSKLIAGLNLAGLEIDRMVLADIAMNDPAAFGVIAQKAKDSLLKQAA